MLVWFYHWLCVAFCSKEMRSAQIAYFIQYTTMKQAELEPKPTKGSQTHAFWINLSDNYCWALLERKSRRKSIGRWSPWNSCRCCTVTHPFQLWTERRQKEIENNTRNDLGKISPKAIVNTHEGFWSICESQLKNVSHICETFNCIIFGLLKIRLKNRDAPSPMQRNTRAWMKVNGRCEVCNYHTWYPCGQTPTWRCFVWSHVPPVECSYLSGARTLGMANKDMVQHSSNLFVCRYTVFKKIQLLIFDKENQMERKSI